jgi:hypothetical protein
MRVHTAEDELLLHQEKRSQNGNMQECTCIADTVSPAEKVQPRICVARNRLTSFLDAKTKQ